MTLCVAGHEMVRSGFIHKPLYVVPNNLISQEYMRLFLDANILVASPNDMQKGRRERTLARMTFGEYEAIIIPQSALGHISVPIEDVQGTAEHLAEQVAQQKNRAHSDYRYNYILQQFQSDIEHYYTKNLEAPFTLEDMGIDYIFVDECQDFKNLKVSGGTGGIKGLQNRSSFRAKDLYYATKYLFRIHEGRVAFTFATGTVLTNSIAECYNWQRYYQEDILLSLGIFSFKDWLNAYAAKDDVWEIPPEGLAADGSGFRKVTRVVGYQNVPELMGLLGQFLDICNREDLDFELPEAQYYTHVAEPYYEQKIFMNQLVERAEAIHNKKPEKGDNMLLVTTDGRKAALDIGLVQENPDPFRYGKIDDCAENVFHIYESQTENRGVQLILSDIYQNNATGYNIYEDITQKLVSKGIPRAEIALAGAYKTTTQQTKLRVLANSGKLRVIIGSTITLGTGQNLQRRLCAIHNLDVPWNPKSLEQREGRIIRTGNLYPVVEIHNYVTERSFDAYTWQLVESKGKLITQLMHGKYIGRSIEEADVKVLSYAECKALATGDTSVLELAKLESEIARLEAVKHNQESAQSQLRYQVAHLLPRNIEQLEEVLPAIEEDAETLADWGEKRVLTLNGKDYDLRKQEDFEYAEEYFRTVTMKHLHNDAHIAFINGMEVTCWTKANYSLFPRHFACLHANRFYTQERPHTITGLKTFTNILEELIVEVQEIHEDRKTKLHAYRQALAAGQAHLDEGFDRQEELDELIQRKESLQNILYTEAI